MGRRRVGGRSDFLRFRLASRCDAGARALTVSPCFAVWPHARSLQAARTSRHQRAQPAPNSEGLAQRSDRERATSQTVCAPSDSEAQRVRARPAANPPKYLSPNSSSTSSATAAARRDSRVLPRRSDSSNSPNARARCLLAAISMRRSTAGSRKSGVCSSLPVPPRPQNERGRAAASVQSAGRLPSCGAALGTRPHDGACAMRCE